MFDCVMGFIVGIVVGCIGVASLGLYAFVKKVEEDNICAECKEKGQCFARRKLFRKSDWLNEFMLVAFLAIKKRCTHITDVSTKQKNVYVLMNAMLIAILFWSKGLGLIGVVFSVSASALLFLSIVDWNTQYIPVEMSIIILICGLIRLFADFSNWSDYVIGLVAVSGFLYIVNWIMTPMLKKKYEGEYELDGVIGDGDIKLMAATGLLLGWKLNFLALGVGCIAGSVIHLILMKIKGSEKQFALGPYLSLGVYFTMICGEQLVGWYLNMMGVKPL